MRILLYPRLAPDVFAIASNLCPAGFELSAPEPTDTARLSEELALSDFLVGFVGPLPESTWHAARKLRLIQLLSAGYDNFPIDRARELRVPVATNGGANAIAVAEHAVMLMLAVLRRLVQLDRDVRAGGWRQTQRGDLRYHEICGKRVGLIGLGMIGREVARRLRGFGVDLCYHDTRRLSPEEEMALGVTCLPLDDLLSTADVLSLHLPLLPETRGIVGARELALLRPEAIIINTARGELVDEQALLEALTSGRLAGAGLDVLAQEPPPPHHPLFSLEQVVLTPHAAGPTWESWPRRFANAYANIERVARGAAPLWVIPELKDLVFPGQIPL